MIIEAASSLSCWCASKDSTSTLRDGIENDLHSNPIEAKHSFIMKKFILLLIIVKTSFNWLVMCFSLWLFASVGL